MKKLMIAILFLIPLIIIMTVNVSGMIISATVKISVESIVLKSRGEFINDVYINFNEYNDANKYYKIDAITYPKLAYANLIWSTSDLSVAYVDKGKVYFVGYGEVTITCHSVDNINISARCDFFVSGDTIYSLDIVEFGTETIRDSIDIARYDRKLLDKIIIPANALKDKIINWSSSNSNIVSIDANGVITANNLGNAVITISIQEDDKTITDTVTVNVLPAYNYLIINNIYISANSVDISDYTVNDNFTMRVLSGNASVADSVLTHTGSGVGEITVELSNSGIISIMKITFTDGNYLLGYKNMDILLDTIWSNGNNIWAGSRYFVLEPIVLNNDYSGALPSVNWSSSDPEVVEIDAGRLCALTGGNATVTISANGFVDGVVNLSVKSPMESISLVLDKADDVRGIEGVRVFGNRSYHYDNLNNGYIDNTFKLEVSSYKPANAEQVYDYRSSNTEYATVDEDGIITFHDASIGNSVIIYVTARYSVSARPVRDYYQFHIVDAVNIGLGISSNENNDDSPVYRVFFELRQLIDSRENAQNVALHSNVFIPSKALGGTAISVCSSVYGNGYKLDAQSLEKVGSESVMYLNYDYNDDIFFRNITINNAIPTDDFMLYSSIGGTVFCVESIDENVTNKMFTLKYCILQYAFCHAYVNGGKMTIDGCVFRNTSGPTMNINTDVNRAPEVTIRNTIFSNIIAPIMMLYAYFDLSTPNVVHDKYATLRLEGNNYIYNWKEIQNIKVDIIPANSLPGNLTETFNSSINKMVRQEFKSDKFDVLKVDAKDPVTGFTKTYVNFSILILGVWNDGSKFNLIYDDKKFVNIEIDISETDIGKVFKDFNKPCYMLTPQNPDGVPTTMPGETYELDAKTLKRLHGE